MLSKACTVYFVHQSYSLITASISKHESCLDVNSQDWVKKKTKTKKTLRLNLDPGSYSGKAPWSWGEDPAAQKRQTRYIFLSISKSFKVYQSEV